MLTNKGVTVKTTKLLDISNDDYHARPEISHSQLSLMRIPALFKYHVIDGNPQSETKCKDRGSLLHILVLEPELFASTYAIAPKCNKRTEIGKKTWERFVTENAGKTVITEEEFSTARAMADAVSAHDAANLIFDSPLVCEKTVIWEDKETGLALRCRPDILIPAAEAKVDIKTTKDVSPWSFAKSMATYNYITQAAFYREGCWLGAQLEINHDVIIAVDSKPPHLVAAYELDANDIQWGRDQVRRWIDAYLDCKAKDHWPGYEGIQQISLPRYATQGDE